MVSEEKPSLILINFLLKRRVEVLLLASRSLSLLFKGHVFKKALNWRILSLWDQLPYKQQGPQSLHLVVVETTGLCVSLQELTPR